MPRLWYAVAAIILALTVGAGIKPIAQTALPTVPDAHAATVPIRLIGSFTAWNASTSSPNPTITVTQGDMVSITLTSTDTTHQFALDVDRDGTMFIAACPTGDTSSTTFTAAAGTTVTINTASLSGTYTYFCTIHSAMVGSFVVNPSGPVGGVNVPVNKLAILAPYIGLALTIIGGSVAAIVYLKRSRREEEVS